MEDCIPEQTLAVLPVASVTSLPFPQSQWHALLLPFAKDDARVLYVSNQLSSISLLGLKGFKLKKTTKLRNVSFRRFLDAQGVPWTLTKIKNITYLSNHAALVEEAALNLQSGHTATWIKPFGAQQLQLHYPRVANFYNLPIDGLRNWVETLVLKLQKKEAGGQLFFQHPPLLTEADQHEALTITPREVQTLAPWLLWPELNGVWAQLRPSTPYLLEFGRQATAQTALILPFADEQKALAAQQTLANHFGALPVYTYQTYPLQPVLDIGLGRWGIQRATLGIFGRCLVLGSSPQLMERWVDALVVGNTLDVQSLGSTSGLRILVSSEHGLGLALRQVAHDLQVRHSLPPQALWQGPLHSRQWDFSSTASGSTGAPAAEVRWQIDLPSNQLQQLWPITAWGQCLIQTEQQDLLLLDAQGRLHWQKKLGEPIIGQMNPVYLSTQGQTVVYFATNKAIHALGSDGLERPGFPLPLARGTSAGLSVGGREHYLFYTSGNGRIYGMDQGGKPLAGWNPGPSLGDIQQPLAFFQSAEADYLLALTEKGRLHVLDRAAQAHFPAQALQGPFRSGPQWQWSAESKRMVVAEAKGRVKVGNAKGEFFSLLLSPGSSEAPLLVFQQLTGDARKDYLAALGAQIYLYSYRGEAFEKVFEQRFSAPIESVQAYGEGEQAKIVLTVPDLHEVHLLNAQGKALPGSPFAGDRAVYLEGAKLLVTAVGSRVYGYTPLGY
jgi:hypothetical protein